MFENVALCWVRWSKRVLDRLPFGWIRFGWKSNFIKRKKGFLHSIMGLDSHSALLMAAVVWLWLLGCPILKSMVFLSTWMNHLSSQQLMISPMLFSVKDMNWCFSDLIVLVWQTDLIWSSSRITEVIGMIGLVFFCPLLHTIGFLASVLDSGEAVHFLPQPHKLCDREKCRRSSFQWFSGLSARGRGN